MPQKSSRAPSHLLPSTEPKGLGSKRGEFCSTSKGSTITARTPAWAVRSNVFSTSSGSRMPHSLSWRQDLSGHAARADRYGGLAADKPNGKRQDDRDDHAGRDRKVEDAVLGFDVNVPRQVSKTEPGEPWP